MPDYAIASIPAYYFLSLAPHFYAVTLASSKTEWNNANPRSGDSISTLKQKLGPQLFARFERAEAAHHNSIENLPLFAAAVGVSVLAERVARTDLGSSTFAATFLAMRAVYSLLYINTESQQFSVVRSLTFVASTGVAFWQIWKSAVALG